MKKFIAHIQNPAPGFRCFKAGDSDESLDFDVQVENRCAPGASPEDIQNLRSQLGESSDELAELYSMHDGIQLYCQADSPGIELSPISSWPKLNQEWKGWFVDLEPDELWEFQAEGIAFGEVCFSGNYFVFHKGKVFYSDHDGGDDEPLAESFSAFLDRIMKDPAQFLEDVGCYTRYTDGKTDAQWIPKEYVRDSNNDLQLTK